MVTRHLRYRTSSKPTMGHRAAFNEEAVDHRCANAGSTALTQRCFSILCYNERRAQLLLPGPSIVNLFFALNIIFLLKK